MSRIETGVVQFDDDWPGVFIRGDNAFSYALTIGEVVRGLEAGQPPNLFFVRQLKGLAALLASAQVSEGKTPEGTRIVTRHPL